ncbi:hypothetical protein SAMN05216516_11039 [Izhakiella capsodis]|uniref:Uncharacterized protein n=1 Tax=Izhakiella capsodis TaxID=1367852 RepID=A0A1I4ZXK6_9GAMM|nr:hypothetical protein SAMN05216516_11039 [Izhakiella capsodis]
MSVNKEIYWLQSGDLLGSGAIDLSRSIREEI